MPRRDDKAEATEGAASATARGARAPRFGTRAHAPMTPPAPDRPDTPDDLRLALGALGLFWCEALRSQRPPGHIESLPRRKGRW